MKLRAINYGVLEDRWEVNLSVFPHLYIHSFLALLIFLATLPFFGILYSACLGVIFIQFSKQRLERGPELYKYSFRPSHITQLIPPNGVVDLIKADFYQFCFYLKIKSKNSIQNVILFKWQMDFHSWRKLKILLLNKNNYL
ncbi:Uncharacterised protein [Taylorella equigenitalis ATCC 35865]|uniref:Uncharacterized protein n=1 Tax=Taylorella equigenitalis ATCC 35865 TaxID=743973 RepID=A0ABN4AUT1_9BURK|nr:hypothetical protein [Taylorella equigenitalis]AFN35588.1 hypothetical protein KUI_0502 [Taylorella equigenitalis ATCC 35865]ASY39014.1 hypothetical protein CA604_02495 [Taylorella equigenitalis]ASY40533.1 hypothetical protein CAV20_02325 [Taylorella equigenitalis]WDU52300.1 hypothetical protein KNO32_02330 [Taylorella equigenitalis]VEG30625.1 Uncharacterised protein [Taylorella equigenitalis ATCC 35865]